MKSKISREHLIISMSDSENTVKEYKADLFNLILDDDSRLILNKKLRTLRDLSRSEKNLGKAFDIITIVLNSIKSNGSRAGFDIVTQALFSHAVILYGACFMKGGVDREVPLKEIEKDIEDSELHRDVMILRHKRFGHLDENHEVRSDHILWQLVVTDGGHLKPFTSSMRGDQIALKNVQFLVEWLDMIEDILGRLRTLKAVLVSDVNALAGTIEIIE